MIENLTGKKQKVYLLDSQHLNGYTYVKNNPLKYIDPSGNLEWWATLNPFNLEIVAQLYAASSAVRWKLPSGVYLFQHSTSYEPNDLHLNSSWSMIAKRVKKSDQFDDAMKNIIKKYSVVNSKEKEVLYFKNNLNRKDGSFYYGLRDNPDLFFAFHNVTIDSVTGYKDGDGNWNIKAKMSDVYDFKWEDMDRYDKSLIANSINNIAVTQQGSGVVSNFTTHITIDKMIKI